MNKQIREGETLLRRWLERLLPQIKLEGSETWWKALVLDYLSDGQTKIVKENGITRLDELDLAPLLRIALKNWNKLCVIRSLPQSLKGTLQGMYKVRNTWVHAGEKIVVGKDEIAENLRCLRSFFSFFGTEKEKVQAIENVLAEVISPEAAERRAQITRVSLSSTPDVAASPKAGIPFSIGQEVCRKGMPRIRGTVLNVTLLGAKRRYEVFIQGRQELISEDQLEAVERRVAWVGASEFRTQLSANQVDSPSGNGLYSLNAARVEFIPYQFKPALKLIHADVPRILIADSVGVGKTIEAGLIIKELEAREHLQNILIVCPKPLVSERKWELEMQRFDEDFRAMAGADLIRAISDTHRDGGIWPTKWRRAILSSSIFNKQILEGGTGRGKRSHRERGMLDLPEDTRFDLVIVDEAHNFRNGGLTKEKSYGYKCVRWLCDHAKAVVMLTATPIQMGDRDLFTLLNLLRPDLVIDDATFRLMGNPNPAIMQCARIVRTGAEGWQIEAKEKLRGVLSTEWGEQIIAKDPRYASVMRRLEKPELSREERVRLISDVEELNSFSQLMNRTRRSDIQAFCLRDSQAPQILFTPAQRELHDALLSFEANALAQLHGYKGVNFMMGTLRRQAASSIYGLAPSLKAFIENRCEQLDIPDVDTEEVELDSALLEGVRDEAKRLIERLQSLPEEDPKLDCLLEILNRKRQEQNNKVILFSTFRNTLNYLEKKLKATGFRVGQVNGSVNDEMRRTLREAFEREREDPEALDVLLFTEVGSEGLDYQFCDTLVNYDLPWNPMRIEQRIGRIDRRGQRSEKIHIYNLITKDTVDDAIYNRCLARIGIFKDSIGDCDEILGKVADEIDKIMYNTSLTPEERDRKLESAADMAIRDQLAKKELREQQDELFGFNLDEYTTADAIREAENIWIAPAALEELTRSYLRNRLGTDEVLAGDTSLLRLTLSSTFKLKLLDDFKSLKQDRDATGGNLAWDQWEAFLASNGHKPRALTFDAETANNRREALFITPSHPLVRQAAKSSGMKDDGGTRIVSLRIVTDSLPAGRWPFCVHKWTYQGFSTNSRLRAFCTEPAVEAELFSLIAGAASDTESIADEPDTNAWQEVESRAMDALDAEQENHQKDVEARCRSRQQSLVYSYERRLRTVSRQAQEATDPSIRQMREGECARLAEEFELKKAPLEGVHGFISDEAIAKGFITIVK